MAFSRSHEGERLRDEVRHFEPLFPGDEQPSWLLLGDEVIVVVAGRAELEDLLRAVPLARRTRSPRFGFRWRIPYRRVAVAALRALFSLIEARLG